MSKWLVGLAVLAAVILGIGYAATDSNVDMELARPLTVLRRVTDEIETIRNEIALLLREAGSWKRL